MTLRNAFGDLALESTLQSIANGSSTLTAKMQGTTDGGTVIDVPVSDEGHLEVAIHDPILPFTSVHTENMTPIFQTDGIYGVNPLQVNVTTGLSFDPGPVPGTSSGSVVSNNEMFVCSTGTTPFSFSTMQSRRRLRYRAGQGSIIRFTGVFNANVANSIVVAGCGTGESGYFFGYNGTSFGILKSTQGIQEIRTFTVTAATSSGGTATFRLNGLDYTVTLATAATTIATANDIASKTFPGWSVEAKGNTVIFLAASVGNKAGTFSFTLDTAVGTAGSFAVTRSGAAAIDTWIPQSQWNGDKCDGTGLSGFTLDPSKGNIYQIDIAWLGFGAVKFKIMTPSINDNNPIWRTVHTINNPNNLTQPHVSQPSFPFTAAAYSAGSTTNVSISIGSFAGFIEGQIRLTGPRASFSNTSTVVGSTGVYHTLFSIRNDLVFGIGGNTVRANQSVVNLLSFGGAHDDATPVILYLLKNASLSGGTNWQPWSNSSCIYYDLGSTTATITDNSQILEVLPIGQGGQILVPLEDTTTVQPGEIITVAAKAVTGTSTWTLATLNTREDQ